MDVKQGIRRNFARRAASYDREAAVQRLMARELLARAGEAVSRARCILEVGCGTGYLTALLRQANPEARLVAVDLDAALLTRARQRLGPHPRVAWVAADGETLARGSFDLIISNAAFQWFTRPQDSLPGYWRALSPGGRVAFATLGPRTFQELGASLLRAARTLNRAAPEIAAAAFLAPESWAALLSRSGFSQVDLAHRLLAVTFPTVRQFLKSLQATGATNPRPRPFSPRLLQALEAAYRADFRQNGSLPVTYELIWAVARK
jgi:malonyl-CoA O-methyltransferase